MGVDGPLLEAALLLPLVAMHPLTAAELGPAFDLAHSVRYGQLSGAYVEDDPRAYLASYTGTYLREEVQAEALTRSLDAFARFLVAASFSQGAVLSITSVARDLGLARKTVEGYFHLLEDLLLGVRLPVFTRRAKRAMTSHAKFYFFDAGVYRVLRPKGPLEPGDRPPRRLTMAWPSPGGRPRGGARGVI